MGNESHHHMDKKSRTQSLCAKNLYAKYQLPLEILKYPKAAKEKSLQVPDGKWGWIIVFSSFFIQFITIGFDSCSGILFLKFQERYETSAAMTAWLGSLATSLRLLLGPLASCLSNRFSERTMAIVGGLILAVSMIFTAFAPDIRFAFLTFGIFGGIGRALAYCPAIVMVGIYFRKNHGLATGIASSGCGVGSFALTLLVAFLFKQFDFTGSFILFGGIALQICVFGALMRPLSVHKHLIGAGMRNKSVSVIPVMENNNYLLPNSVTVSISENDKVQKSDAKQQCRNADGDSMKKRQLVNFAVLKNMRFLGFCITMLLSSLAKQSVYVFLPVFAKEAGILGDRSSEYTVAITSVFSTFAKVMAGFIFDCSIIKPYRVYLYNVLMSGLVVVSFIIPSVQTFSQLAIICGLYGLIAGSYTAQKSVIVVDILGRDKLVHSYGILMMFQGIGSLIGPPLSGLFKDLNGGYEVAFYIGGVGMLVGTLILLISNIAHFIHGRKKKKGLQKLRNLQLFTTINMALMQSKHSNTRSTRHSA